MDVERFARQFDNPAAPGVLGRALRSPNRTMVRDTVAKFDRGDPVVSSSGLTAEIAMKWARATKVPFRLGWSAELEAFIVIKSTEKQVDDLAQLAP